MLITHEKMKEINDIQVKILENVSEVCDKLGIKFFMVHGSLLGTIRNNKFVPDDDDIDIAFFREDYERFLKEAPKYLEEKYFVQSNESDKAYPLEFAKVRDSETTYIVEIGKKLKMNHGIYIDVFPIDNCPEGKLSYKIYNIKRKILRQRIAGVWDIKCSGKKKLLALGLKALFPSLNKAIKILRKVLTSVPEGRLVSVSGGKGKEQRMLKEWFNEAKENVFEGVKVYVPVGYDEYLTRIYGDYKNRTLVENKLSDDSFIEVNACVVDTEKPYTEYIS